MSFDTDLLVMGAHPDDAEIGAAGLMLKMKANGRKVVIADMTRGEMGTRGTQEDRDRECERASGLLGLDARVNLGLPDTGLRDNEDCLGPVVEALRKWRPRILVTHHENDRHPDHVATAAITARAWFCAGLQKYRPELGGPFRPQMLLRYPGNDHVEPGLCVDISAFLERKLEVVRCYATQVDVDDSSKNVSGVDHLTRLESRDRYFGARIGCVAAEPFVLAGPVPVPDPFALLE